MKNRAGNRGGGGGKGHYQYGWLLVKRAAFSLRSEGSCRRRPQRNLHFYCRQLHASLKEEEKSSTLGLSRLGGAQDGRNEREMREGQR